jgi:hypothetical protein
MGLTMAKMIVEEKLRGSISVANTSNGAIFTVVLTSI